MIPDLPIRSLNALKLACIDHFAPQYSLRLLADFTQFLGGRLYKHTHVKELLDLQLSALDYSLILGMSMEFFRILWSIIHLRLSPLCGRR